MSWLMSLSAQLVLFLSTSLFTRELPGNEKTLHKDATLARHMLVAITNMRHERNDRAGRCISAATTSSRAATRGLWMTRPEALSRRRKARLEDTGVSGVACPRSAARSAVRRCQR